MAKMHENIVVGLDVGSSEICVVVGLISQDSQIEIIGVGTAPSGGVRKGSVINIERTVDSISKAIKSAESMAGCEIDSVFVNISGTHLKSINNYGTTVIKGKEITIQDINKVIEAARAIAISNDREVLHVLPQEFIVDDQHGIREPLGMCGIRLEARVHIITGSVLSAKNVVKCANRCGLKVKDLIFSGLASASSVLSYEEKELGVALLDIGGGNTDLIVYQGGAVKHIAQIPIGGELITSDIATAFRVPIRIAESLKKLYGTAAANPSFEAESLEVTTANGSSSIISKYELSEIINRRVKEIFEDINDEITKNNLQKYMVNGVVLTGGTANLHGLTEVGESILNTQVHSGNVHGIGGLTELVQAPQYATAVGLVVYGACDLGNKLNSGRFAGGYLHKMVSWFAEHF